MSFSESPVLLIVGIVVALFVFMWLLGLFKSEIPEPAHERKETLSIASYTVKVSLELDDVSPSQVIDAGKQLRAEFEQFINARHWIAQPYIRSAGIRKGSLLFDYDIYILVTGATIAVLRNYSSMKEGLENIFEDVASVRSIVRRVFRRSKSARLQQIELRLVSEEELSRLISEEEMRRLASEEELRRLNQLSQPKPVHIAVAVREQVYRK